MTLAAAMDSIAWWMVIGPGMLGFGIYYGLSRVAEAIEYYTDNKREK